MIRRRFLSILAALLALPRSARALAPARPGRPEPPLALEPAPVGALESRASGILTAAVEGIVPGPVETSHYTDLFRWRAEHVPGCRALYARLAEALEAEAARRGVGSFEACAPAVRREILDAATDGKSKQARLFEKFVLRDVRVLFARTDALVQLGYESWPGTPRGLESYADAPPGARGPGGRGAERDAVAPQAPRALRGDAKRLPAANQMKRIK